MNNILEYSIDKLIKNLIDSKKGFGWKNHPNRNYKGTYIIGEPFDYCIITPNKIHVFDTKITSKSNTWSILKKDKKQAINLKKCSELNPNVNSYFLIYFKVEHKIKKIMMDDLFKILKVRQHVKINDCLEFNIKKEFDI